MATILLSVILVSGFIFVNLSLSTRYRYKRSNGWDAYFFVAAWGIVFFLVGGFLCFILNATGVFRWVAKLLHLTTDSFNGVVSTTTDKAQRNNEIKQMAWVVISISLSALCGWWSKRKTSKGDRRWDALAKAVGNNSFEAMLMEASARQFPIIITLSSRKIYVGLVTCPALEHGMSDHLEILPMLSGHRDKDDLTINITTNYHAHYLESGVIGGLSHLNISDFRVLVPKDEVETLSFFDTETYNKFKQDEERDRQNCKSLGRTPRTTSRAQRATKQDS
ncbi:hypothetical protein UDZ25_09100 [Serratia marcescens]|uniref:hypothetical protein n=1 Tax=Serratia TaxID=613 RepID=UPI0039BFF4DC|nr:hypothetical protein [Serratia marcescens]HBK4670736.1 hypothetical protein [Serratia marcescens]